MRRWYWFGTIWVFVLFFAACRPIQPLDSPAPIPAPVEEPVMETEAALDPAAVMAAYTAAINAHDVEAALALVAEDAVYARPAGEFNGREEVRGFIEGLVARNVRVELIGERTVEGERVMWMSRVTLSNLDDPDGPDAELMNQSESIVRNGQIVFHQASPVQQP